MLETGDFLSIWFIVFLANTNPIDSWGQQLSANRIPITLLICCQELNLNICVKLSVCDIINKYKLFLRYPWILDKVTGFEYLIHFLPVSIDFLGYCPLLAGNLTFTKSVIFVYNITCILFCLMYNYTDEATGFAYIWRRTKRRTKPRATQRHPLFYHWSEQEITHHQQMLTKNSSSNQIWS